MYYVEYGGDPKDTIFYPQNLRASEGTKQKSWQRKKAINNYK